jgi:hypothetical protein
MGPNLVLEIKSPMIIFKIRNHVLRIKESHASNHGLQGIFFSYAVLMEPTLK